MAKIVGVQVLQADLKPKVKRTDAVQSFELQETPIVRIRDADGVIGTGYSYTIGTGGSSVIHMLNDHLVPVLLGREADDIEAIWRDLMYRVHATTVGPVTSLALAAVDTALWDLRGRRTGLAIAPARPAAPRSGSSSTTPRMAGCILTSPNWSRRRSAPRRTVSALPS